MTIILSYYASCHFSLGAIRIVLHYAFVVHWVCDFGSVF